MQIEMPEVFSYLFQPNRYKGAYGGRGGAKSWAFADALLIQGAQRPLRILCAREVQKSIRESVHSLLVDRINALGLTQFYNVTEKAITGSNGTRFFFEGLLRNIESIKSIEGIDICWIEEAAAVSENSWKVLIPTIRKEGSEIWFTFNPRLKTDAAYQRFVLNPPENGVIKKVSWRDNPYFPVVLREEMEALKARDYDEYLHVWEGELKQFADGSIFGPQLRKAKQDGRIARIPVENVPVNTFWDLGRNDHTAIWFHQRVGLQNRFIKFYQSRLVDLDHYAIELSRLEQACNWVYGTHYLPHDADHVVLGAHGRSRRQMLEGFGLKCTTVPRDPSKEHCIAVTRDAFSSCWFDEIDCEEGLESLSNYEYVYDEKHDTHRPTPLHNWASNGADAFQQFGIGYRGPENSFKAQIDQYTQPQRAYMRGKHNTLNPGTAHII